MLSKHNSKIVAVATSNMLPLQLLFNNSGKVHGKFKSGLNVQFGEKLVYIGAVGSPLSAFGMLVNELDLTLLLEAVQVSELVVIKGKQLVFYGTYGIITLDYTAAELIDLKIPSINCQIEQIAESKLYKYLSNLQLQSKIGISLDHKTKQHLQLLSASNKDNYQDNLEIIRFFTGRGIGLTPSGDDLLLGFTFVLRIFGCGDIWIQCMQEIADKKLTTMISSNYSNALLQGYVSLSCSDLALALDMQDEARIASIVSRVAEFGHTSGNDTLYGFLLGLHYLNKVKICL